MAKKWTEEEIQLLKQLYPDSPAAVLEEVFQRKISAITFKANSLKIKRQKYWSHEETKLLKKLYPALNNDELKKIFKRSISSLRNKASELKIKKTGAHPKIKRWSNQETALLKEIYANSSQKELEQIFGRSINAIRNKAFQLGIKRKVSSQSKETNQE